MTGTLIAELMANRHMLRGSAKNLGVVKTGVAVITQIVCISGVDLVALLPKKFERATTYTMAICASSSQPESAAALIALMATAGIAALSLTCGFEA